MAKIQKQINENVDKRWHGCGERGVQIGTDPMQISVEIPQNARDKSST